jgi:hypothetical protein
MELLAKFFDRIFGGLWNLPGQRLQSLPLTTQDVLRQEAEAIHDVDLSDVEKADLYRTLNRFDTSALCLSGGGIRSAAFALGVIQSLAAHPRNPDDSPPDAADKSLLSKFHYLSTVSGGGYIGGWLSAWIARTGFGTVWRNLIGRPAGPDTESAPIGWLRSYSNYLTPELGLVSADTWAIVAVYLRNLLLNWIVILPAVCAVILSLKVWIVTLIGLSNINHATQPRLFVAMTGAMLLIISLSFVTLYRPSRREGEPDQKFGATRNPDGAFIWGSLIWSVGSAIATTQYLGIIDVGGSALPTYSMTRLVGLGMLAGATIYALGWLLAWGRASWRSRPWKREWPDLALWTVSGLVYGALVGLGFHFYLQVPAGEATPLIAIINSPVTYLIVGVPWILFSQWTADMVFVGLTCYRGRFDTDQEWLGRAAGWLLVAAIAWSLGMFVIFAGFLAEISSTSSAYFIMWFVLVPITATTGLVVAVTGAFSLSRHQFSKGSVLSTMLNAGISVVGPLFIGALIFTLSIMLDQILLGRHLFERSYFSQVINGLQSITPDFAPWLDMLYRLAWGWAVSTIIGLAASRWININRFSLHALYRNRLIRAFLGASRERTPDPFTGLDPSDDPRMHQLWPQPDAKGAWPARQPGDWQPFHVLNLTLNVVSSRHLAWQERKAAPFTISPLHCGTSIRSFDRMAESGTGDDAPVGAYRGSQDYGDPMGMTLGTAMAISGAATNPNMGYHSSPSVTFLMTMFNLRLGWWLGNPGPEGSSTFRHSRPAIAILPLVHEILGLTTDDQPYIHVSDGGHFENLGLYEMVRRRCRFILISDAGRDPQFAFEDLGNAVRKISIDLGVPIRFERLERLKRRPHEVDKIVTDGDYHALGVIDYQSADGKTDVENGAILYVKAGYHGTESAGVRSYAMANLEFPHHSTANQWFSESQFESYRALGSEIMESLLTRALTHEPYARQPSLGNLAAALRATAAGIGAASEPSSSKEGPIGKHVKAP